MWADQLPILVFSVAFFGFTLTRVFDLSVLPTGIILAAYVALGFWLRAVGADVLNGSLIYANALAGLLISGALLQRSRHPLARHYLAASGVFILALSARTVDMTVCDRLTIGTHFLWHLLIALLLWILLRTCVEHNRRSE